MKKTRPASPVSLRLDPALRRRLQAVQDRYIATIDGPVKSVSTSEMVRWALEEGLTAIEAKLSKKAGRS